MAMVVLAFVYLAVFAIDILVVAVPEPAKTLLWLVGNGIWLAFVLDLVYRTYLAPQRLTYLATHPVDVIAVVVPAFRFLRVLRIITAGQWLISRGSRLAVGRVALALVIAVTFMALVGGLSVLDAERSAPGSNITTFGDAVWWAAVTMSTVGYGDVYPVTIQGRFVAAGMMVVGISLLGIVSATLATGFMTQFRRQEASDTELVMSSLTELHDEVSQIHEGLAPVPGARQPSAPPRRARSARQLPPRPSSRGRSSRRGGAPIRVAADS